MQPCIVAMRRTFCAGMAARAARASRWPPWPAGVRRASSPRSHRASAPKRRRSPTPRSSTAFFKTAFGAEFHLAGRVDRIRKYDVPVRVFVDNSRPDRGADARTRRRHRQADPASRHRDGRTARRRQCDRHAGARPRPLPHHRVVLRRRPRPRNPRRSTRNACRASARTTSFEIVAPT